MAWKFTAPRRPPTTWGDRFQSAYKRKLKKMCESCLHGSHFGPVGCEYTQDCPCPCNDNGFKLWSRTRLTQAASSS